MRVAIPVMDESLRIARNAGHTPYFAIFEIGGGMFRSVNFQEIRENPKMKGHEISEEDHHGAHKCDHEGDEAHIKAHDLMADALNDCDFLVVKMACKNTANSMKNSGIKMKKYNGEKTNAKEAIGEISGEF